MSNDQKQEVRELVPASEEARVARSVLAKLNAFAPLPVQAIRYEMLDAGVPGMSMHVERGAYKTKRFLLGGYRAQLKFSLWYRIQPGDSGKQRLTADEALNAIGDWICDTVNLPALGEPCRALRAEISSRASVSAAWDNGDEDHFITIKFTYEVIQQGGHTSWPT